MSTSSNQPVTEKRLEEILDRKLEEKLEQKLEQKLEEKLEQKLEEKLEQKLEEKLKPYVTQDYLEDRLELFEKGIDEKIRSALAQQTEEIVSLISKHITNILKPFGLTVANHEQRITQIEQHFQS